MEKPAPPFCPTPANQVFSAAAPSHFEETCSSTNMEIVIANLVETSLTEASCVTSESDDHFNPPFDVVLAALSANVEKQFPNSTMSRKCFFCNTPGHPWHKCFKLRKILQQNGYTPVSPRPMPKFPQNKFGSEQSYSKDRPSPDSPSFGSYYRRPPFVKKRHLAHRQEIEHSHKVPQCPYPCSQTDYSDESDQEESCLNCQGQPPSIPRRV